MCVCGGRPVRMHMDLDSNMRMAGKRYPYYAKYTVSLEKFVECVHFSNQHFLSFSLFDDLCYDLL